MGIAKSRCGAWCERAPIWPIGMPQASAANGACSNFAHAVAMAPTALLGNILAKREGIMAGRRARISERWLYDPEHPRSEIELDTSAWFEWLEAVTTISFSYAIFEPSCG